MADAVRLKATELAVELLRESMPKEEVEILLSYRTPEREFRPVAQNLASRIGALVKEVAIEIDRGLR